MGQVLTSSALISKPSLWAHMQFQNKAGDRERQTPGGYQPAHLVEMARSETVRDPASKIRRRATEEDIQNRSLASIYRHTGSFLSPLCSSPLLSLPFPSFPPLLSLPPKLSSLPLYPSLFPFSLSLHLPHLFSLPSTFSPPHPPLSHTPPLRRNGR